MRETPARRATSSMVVRWMPRRQNSSNAASRMRALVSSWSSTAPSTAALSAPTRSELEADSVPEGDDAGSTLHLALHGRETNPCDLYHTYGQMLIQRCTLCITISLAGARARRRGAHGHQQAQGLARGWSARRSRRVERGVAGGRAGVVDVEGVRLGRRAGHRRRPQVY